MEQAKHGSQLFDQGEIAWRCEIQAKGGGGPFDPNGWSVLLTDPSGKLIALTVSSIPSAFDGPQQVIACLAGALAEVIAILEDRELAPLVTVGPVPLELKQALIDFRNPV